MKANEAPKKIYITKNILGELRDSWDALPSDTFTNIEYTRTDAFIKKAEEFLYEKLNSGEMECGDIVVFIEKFRNCMKG